MNQNVTKRRESDDSEEKKSKAKGKEETESKESDRKKSNCETESGKSGESSNRSVAGVVQEGMSKDTLTTPSASDESDGASIQDLGTVEINIICYTID